MERGLATAGAMINQLQRILFLVVQAKGGMVEIKEGEINPLWRLDKKRKEDGTLVLTSSISEPPGPEQLKALAEKLRGTGQMISDVQKELGLEHWPEDYLAYQIVDLVLFHKGKWCDAAEVREATNTPGPN